ncbi:uncharacterized protein B0H18DRAFT_955294 [Fomitopsis serialis]|uniref:uncharacterized protein n=1 Tax=Fomitopsis serialis TaxID=139415 RepID=UPI0020073D94|nr:uncharacterized protein B0H18DRAFT_955294 [Neoantrodia serialis]KAH9924895.1 hypothetical protein B0H18DRAFT_955294 [Neoantrodia serialis]
MNFLDTYDIASSPTPPANQPETSLNEEVQQVVGQLSRFWGGFRKQSQAVIETARKDLGEAVTQAQKELSKLAEAPAEPSTSSTEEGATDPSADAESGEKDKNATPHASTPDDVDNDDDTTPEPSTSQSQTLLSRLQATLPPNLVAAVQDKLPESLTHARSTSLSAPDFAALRSTLAGELARVQGQSGELLQRVQAGDLLHKGEGLLKQVQGGGEEFLREAGEFLREAVRVVPPDSSEGSAGVVWDGTDVWMIPAYSPTATPTEDPASERGKGKGRERRSVDSARAATRAQAMLTQLRHDPQVVRTDPSANPTEREAFAAWTAREVDAKGGIDGAVWSKRIEDETAEREELATLLEPLVPAEIDASTFWTRYFFRVHQVEREEERRRALLQGTTEHEDDFSWEDDDDDAPATSPTASPAKLTNPSTSSPASAVPPNSAAAASTPAASTPATASPRQSSEESYDVVSSQVSRTASTVDVAEEKEREEPAPAAVKEKGKAAGEKEKDDGEEDSDWE